MMTFTKDGLKATKKRLEGWYCLRCQYTVPPEQVTFEETHTICGTPLDIADPDLAPALAALEEAWDFLTDIRAELLDCDEKKDLWWRLAVYTDELEPAAEEE